MFTNILPNFEDYIQHQTVCIPFKTVSFENDTKYDMTDLIQNNKLSTSDYKQIYSMLLPMYYLTKITRVKKNKLRQLNHNFLPIVKSAYDSCNVACLIQYV